MKKVEKYNKADLRNTGLMALASLKETGGENDTVTNPATVNDIKEVKPVTVDNAGEVKVKTATVVNAAGEVKVKPATVDNAAGEVKPKLKNGKEKSLSELLDEKFGIINDGLQKSVEKSFNTFNSKVGQIAKDVNDLASTVNGIKEEVATIKSNSISKSEVEKMVNSAIADAKLIDIEEKVKEAVEAVDSSKIDTKQTVEELAAELASKPENKEEEKSSGISCGVKVGIATGIGVALGYAIKAILSSGE